MIKTIKYLIFISVFFLIANCSFDKKTGIWSGGEKEKERIAELERQQKEVIETIDIYSSETVDLKEIKATKSIVLSKPQNNLSWEMSGLNVQNFTGNIYFSGMNKNFLKKKIGKNKFSLSKTTSSPLIYNDEIFFSDDTGTIYSINLNGKLIWKKNIYTKKYKKIYKILTFSIYKGKIYVADNIGFIYSIDLQSGELIWIKNHGVPLKSRIKIFENKIFLINQDNRIICLDTQKGSKIWDIRAIASFIKSQKFLSLAISKKGEVVALTSSGDLLKIDSQTGEVDWSLNITASMSSHETDFFQSSEVVISKKDIIFSATSSIYSFNIDTGYVNWDQAIRTTNTPIVDGNNIFLVTNNGFFINLDRISGKIIWSNNILKNLKKRKRNTETTGFIMGSGKIYITTLNGYLIICSANSGEMISFKKIGNLITTSPIISNGSLYILTEKPMILGFN